MYLRADRACFVPSALSLCGSEAWQPASLWVAMLLYTLQCSAQWRGPLTHALHLPGSNATMVPAPVEMGGAVDGYAPRGPRKSPTSIWVMSPIPMALRPRLVPQWFIPVMRWCRLLMISACVQVLLKERRNKKVCHAGFSSSVAVHVCFHQPGCMLMMSPGCSWPSWCSRS